MTTPYTKAWKTFEEQAILLRERGMIITDFDAAVRHLARCGYYRLSGYWYPMRRPGPGIVTRDLRHMDAPCRDDHFLPESAFEHVAALYVWDKRLRLLLLDAIERLEIGVRVAIAYECGQEDRFLHGKPEKMGISPARMGEYARFFSKHAELESRSKEAFKKHFDKKYGGETPIWVAVELWEFGIINQFYALLDAKLRFRVAKRFALKPDTFESWLTTLRYLRNTCAHHARLWNRELVEIPKTPGSGEADSIRHAFTARHGTNSKLYPTLCLIAFLLKKLQPDSTWSTRLHTHLIEFPSAPHFALRDMGVPEGWESLPGLGGRDAPDTHEPAMD